MKSLAIATAVAIGFLCVLAYMPPVVLFVVATVCTFLALSLGIALLLGRRLSKMSAPVPAAQEREAQAAVRTQHNVTRLPQRPPAEIVEFPDRDDAK